MPETSPMRTDSNPINVERKVFYDPINVDALLLIQYEKIHHYSRAAPL